MALPLVGEMLLHFTTFDFICFSVWQNFGQLRLGKLKASSRRFWPVFAVSVGHPVPVSHYLSVLKCQVKGLQVVFSPGFPWFSEHYMELPLQVKLGAL